MRHAPEMSLAAAEHRLRDAFTAAGQAVAPGSIRGLPAPADRAARPPRAVRRWAGRGPWRGPWFAERVLVPMAAVTVVALVAAALTVIVPKLLDGSHRPAAAGVTQAQDYDRALGGPAPRYFVGVRLLGKGDSLASLLSVYSAVSGRVVASFQPPGQGRWFRAVATLGSDRTFVAAVSAGTGADRCHTWFYRFSISSRGQPVNLAELSASAPGVVADGSALAASADGRMVAYATQACTTRPASRVGVIHLPTGKVTAWTARRSKPRNLSLSANGSLLSIVAGAGGGPARTWAAGADAAWILRTGDRPGPLARHYRKVPLPPGGVLAAALSPSGAVLFAIIENGPPGRRNGGTVAGYDAVTGAQVLRVRVLAGRTAPPGMTTAVSGRFALVYLLRPSRVQELNLATGQQRSVPLAAADTTVGAAW
jgi:hypothetical protein